MSALLELREPSARYLREIEPALIRHFEAASRAFAGTAGLRELILGLAVSGRLVPQHPEDESAELLLRRIAIAKGQIEGQRRGVRGGDLPPIEEDEVPFEIPATWSWARLGAITNYGSPTKSGPIGPDAWVLDLEDIEKGTGRLLNRARRNERPALSEKNSFGPGDVLYGKLRPYLNKVLVADEAGVCTTELMPFRCYGDWNPGYFKVALSSPMFLEYANARSYGMKMPRLGTEDARQAVLPVPPLQEQARIVARVDELMRLCDALEEKGRLEAEQHARLLSTLLGTLTDSATPEELAANWQRVAEHFELLLDRPLALDSLEDAVVSWAVRGLLVPQRAEEEPARDLLTRIRTSRSGRVGAAPGSILNADQDAGNGPFALPKSWAWARWIDVALKIGDIDHKMPAEAPDGVPYVSPRDFFGQNEIDFERAKKIERGDFEVLARKIRPSKGDLIYPRYGTIGDVRLVETDREFLASYSCAVVKVFPGLINPVYQYLVSISDLVRLQAKAATNKTTQPNVGLKSIQQYLVPVPPLAEQDRIVARVAELRRLCATLRERLQAQQATQSRLAEALVEQALSA